ncbi:uncharacterized protein LOC130624048 [Hydractinia symbiolongicarpus]|uniref:uncharacterized protein LOC130624048 n=1 Tax=Hydractinia symbiolongicarpus TaxID=13093 RepID=UPI00254C8AC0|nr:uncharacterized protein LOC130624048 [Hydractinia symbiolongicarpus]
MKNMLAFAFILYFTSQVIAENITATLQVQFNSTDHENPAPLNQTLIRGTYAIDAFIAANNTPCYNFVYTVSKFGAFIPEVCDVKQNNGSYWFFYINNIRSSVGVSCYEVKDNDVLTLRYEKYVPNTHQGMMSSQNVTTTLQVEFVSIDHQNPPPQNLTIGRGTFAIDAFIAANNTPCYNFVYTVSTFGALITEVCDVKQNNVSHWFFYINNTRSSVGVSCYEVKNNDVLTLRYENSSYAVPTTTPAATATTAATTTPSRASKLSFSYLFCLLCFLFAQI